MPRFVRKAKNGKGWDIVERYGGKERKVGHSDTKAKAQASIRAAKRNR